MLSIRLLSQASDRLLYLDPAWDILSESYQDVPGGLLFNDKFDLLDKTMMWKVILKNNELMALTVFKAKMGLKLVAMGADREHFGKMAVDALAKSIDLKHVWMEVSGKAETFVMKRCNAKKYLIENNRASVLLKKEIALNKDGYHYVREISGIEKEKLIVGTPYNANIDHIVCNTHYLSSCVQEYRQGEVYI